MPKRFLKERKTQTQHQLDKLIGLSVQLLVRLDDELDNLRNTEYFLETVLNSQPVNYYVQNKDRYKDELNQDSYYWEDAK